MRRVFEHIILWLFYLVVTCPTIQVVITSMKWDTPFYNAYKLLALMILIVVYCEVLKSWVRKVMKDEKE